MQRQRCGSAGRAAGGEERVNGRDCEIKCRGVEMNGESGNVERMRTKSRRWSRERARNGSGPGDEDRRIYAAPDGHRAATLPCPAQLFDGYLISPTFSQVNQVPLGRADFAIFVFVPHSAPLVGISLRPHLIDTPARSQRNCPDTNKLSG
ncbi:hypothetical protein J6590_032828 [Homalodisca vitripennis]|nr:hypothetical protein J6590_032828 [Homalodisca vitripennis]